MVLAGFDAASSTFLVHDPCQASGPVKLSAALVDKARTSFGTDEDLIWLDLSVQPSQHQPQASCSCQASSDLGADVPSEVC